MDTEVSPATLQWREMFAKSMASELSHNRELLKEIRDLMADQNGRIRQNEVAIASLKTWVPVVGGAATLGSIIATAVIQVLMR